MHFEMNRVFLHVANCMHCSAATAWFPHLPHSARCHEHPAAPFLGLNAHKIMIKHDAVKL